MRRCWDANLGERATGTLDGEDTRRDADGNVSWDRKVELLEDLQHYGSVSNWCKCVEHRVGMSVYWSVKDEGCGRCELVAEREKASTSEIHVLGIALEGWRC